MAPSPVPSVCQEKQQLIAEFINAVSDYHRMLSAQVASLRNGDGLQFGKETNAAQKRVDKIRHMIAVHHLDHGC